MYGWHRQDCKDHDLFADNLLTLHHQLLQLPCNATSDVHAQRELVTEHTILGNL